MSTIMKGGASPKKITLNKHGSPATGYLTAAEANSIPFPMKRIFWTYFTPERIIRGKHAHKRTTVLVFALTGKIIITTETVRGAKQTFVLDKPNIGLLIPPMIWHTQRYSHTAIQLVLASRPYEEKEYIRNYQAYKKLCK
jgi:dTDP-4-dehydrorhamnose 3,5-epimerase-like enzyme